MVITLDDLPLPGQTLLGDKFQVFAGGKGANQAVAARRAGAEVRFCGAVGGDDFGRNAISGLQAEGIDTSLTETIHNEASGVAMIFVSSSGENCIGVAPGANARLNSDAIRDRETAIAEASVVLMQLETPLDTIATAVEIASRHSVRCILNPAPAAQIPESVFSGLFCITPNQTEIEELTGLVAQDKSSAALAAQSLLERGVANVVVTMGSQGALLCNDDGEIFQSATVVDVVDTTGAGDTFNGVFAARVSQGAELQDALKTAVAAATLSVQSEGAIASIPHIGI